MSGHGLTFKTRIHIPQQLLGGSDSFLETLRCETGFRCSELGDR